jgi:hypothetical protein
MHTKSIFGILTVATALILPPKAQAQSFLTNGLVAYYPFNGNPNDASGNGNNGRLFGGANLYGWDRFGNSNSCLYLPGNIGTGSGVDIPSLSNMPYFPATYSAWFRLNNYAPGNIWTTDMPLVGRDQAANEYGGALVMFSEPGAGVTNRMGYYTGGGGALAAASPPTNQWWEVVATLDASGNANVYFNGTNVPSTGTVRAGQPLDFRIGCSASGNNTGTHFVWNGLIDDVRVYNRALSSNEVAQLYAFEAHPISITNEPPTVTNSPGDTVVLSVGASGVNSLDYVWYFSGTNIDNGSNATLNISNISQAFFGNYYLVVGNGFNSVTSSVATIFEPATIISQPLDVVAPLNSTATFSVLAVGYPAPIYYQWALNGTNLTNTANIMGATSNTLTLSNIDITSTGNYQVVADNSAGSTDSTIATLNMSPSIYTPFIGATPIWGTSATLSVGAIGSGTLTYQWYFNGQPLQGAIYPQLTFNSIQLTNDGFYSIVISSPYGSVTNVAEQVFVNPADVALGFYPGLTITAAAGNSYIIQSELSHNLTCGRSHDIVHLCSTGQDVNQVSHIFG